MNKGTALITGATSGIGLELAKVFANQDYNLVLVSRNIEQLQKVAAVISKSYNVRVEIIAKDLSLPDSSREIFSELAAKNIDIDVLVNNAGFGIYGKFAESSLERQLGVIELNIKALTSLTGLFLPKMIKNKRGKILNVASTAAFQPGPLMAVYYASKSYVLNFSEALRSELKGTGIYVTALCPGPTRTNFQSLDKNFSNTRLFKSGFFMTAEQVALCGFSGLMKNKAVVIPGFRNKVLAIAAQVSPRNLVTSISHWLLKN